MDKLHYSIFIDTGGTFTDCIALISNGQTRYQKVLSSGKLRAVMTKRIDNKRLCIKHSWSISRDIFMNYSIYFPEYRFSSKIKSFDLQNNIITISDSLPVSINQSNCNIELTATEEAPILAIRMITETALKEKFPSMEIRLGSTKGTNALLENKGAKTALLITKGFRDLLKIRNQTRPDIFSKNIKLPPPVNDLTIEIDERISGHGKVLKSIDTEEIREQLMLLKKKRVKSIAVALLNSVKNPIHEKKIRILCRELGFSFISLSSDLSVMIKLLERAETTVVNAYLSPVIQNYISGIVETLKTKNLKIMTSAGGLVNSSYFNPKDSLLSGPAGGVVGASIVGQNAGFSNLISFDMGGTSTDASRFSQSYDYCYEPKVGNARIMSPALSIETVAAGGGSICGYDGFKLFVGPESAGANPGPACYGAGGPLTITDINLLAGRLLSENFSIPIYPEKSEEKLIQLEEQIFSTSNERPEKEKLLDDLLNITNERMAEAIQKISVQKGYDPVNYALVSFGGAGGLHACEIAQLLGMRNIVIPKEAGLLSAYGIQNARIERFATRRFLTELNRIEYYIPGMVEKLEINAKSKLEMDGISKRNITTREKLLYLRLKGQDSSIEINWRPNVNIAKRFKRKYIDLYGHWVENRPIEIEAIRVVVSEKLKKEEDNFPKHTNYIPEPALYNKLKEPAFYLKELNPGAKIKGPAIILNDYSTFYVKKGWKYSLDERYTGIVSRQSYARRAVKASKQAEIELFTNRFMSIAENMGAMLQRTALSVNIKERLDFSCALLDAEGFLVANAPHIPVHLGGIGVCVRKLLKEITFRSGDTVISNHPGFGGSHLPDVTTITPVFIDNQLLAFVVNRAHHSELGGISPGSMPPSATNLAEEGVVIKAFYLMRRGKADWEGIRNVFLNAPYPTRTIQENMADLNAQLAANMRGQEALQELVLLYGKEKIKHYFKALKNYASDRIKNTLRSFPDGVYKATEKLDDGSPLVVKINKKEDHIDINFKGTASTHPANMNATPAIVHSVVIYTMRLLLNESIPLNDGLLDPVTINIPKGMLNPDFPDDPFLCPAVVGGNVEISQRLTDTLLKAFKTMAASQGTMNNVLFGNNKFGYYETLAGGTGAGENFHGCDAVHHHMTNTRITDPEVIEQRFPVRILRFEIRPESGGDGKWKGGNGLIREYEFLEDVNLSILSQRRKTGPYGLKGGKKGKVGKQYLIRKNGKKVAIKGIDNIDILAGDHFVIETPGGGGWGKKKS